MLSGLCPVTSLLSGNFQFIWDFLYCTSAPVRLILSGIYRDLFCIRGFLDLRFLESQPDRFSILVSQPDQFLILASGPGESLSALVFQSERLCS